jgi:hypothetical protein
MTKIEKSGSIRQRHGSADLDPHQHVMYPQHCWIYYPTHITHRYADLPEIDFRLDERAQALQDDLRIRHHVGLASHNRHLKKQKIR